MLIINFYKNLYNFILILLKKIYYDFIIYKYQLYYLIYNMFSLNININLLLVDYIYYWFYWSYKYFLNNTSLVINFRYFLKIKKTEYNINFFKKTKENKLFIIKNFKNNKYLINLLNFNLILKSFTNFFKDVFYKSFSFGFFYLRGFLFVLFIDACLIDDEPLWEPIEWSLVQVWILFIFGFAWVAENLIVSRYGSYTGRDKRVWMAWYKAFWWIEGFYAINYGTALFIVIVPYYFELQYNLAFIHSWWNWYSRVFFFKFISLFSLVLLLTYFLQITIRWLNWKKSFILVIFINIFISYLIYTHFIIIFFSYFTDVMWYQKVRAVDYIQLSHEPFKWGWGTSKRDHFAPHAVKTVLWFKNDGPFATAFFTIHLFLFFCIFSLYLYWIILCRRIYSTKEVPITQTTYCVSSLRQFFYFFFYFYLFIIISYITQYARYSIDFYWLVESKSWFTNFIEIIINYPNFFISIFPFFY